MRQGSRCPTLSGMDVIPGDGISAGRPDAGVSKGPKSGRTGRAQDHPDAVCVLEQFSQALTRLEQKRDAIFERAAEETVKLALAISEKIIGREVSVDPHVVLKIVRKAMQKIKEGQSIRIRLHPHDLEALRQSGLDTFCRETTVGGFAFQADAALGRGDCLLETGQENIDAGIRSQLAVIREAFGALGHHPPQDGSVTPRMPAT